MIDAPLRSEDMAEAAPSTMRVSVLLTRSQFAMAVISSNDGTPSADDDKTWYQSTQTRQGGGVLMQGRSRYLWVAACAAALLTISLGIGILRSASDAEDAMAKGRYDQARGFYAEAAATGDPGALNSLASLHYLGLGGAANHRLAAELYFEAASKGHAGAQLNLAHLFKQGLGVKTDLVRAYAWYNMADISGSPWAEYYITQTALEYTLSPMQMATARERFSRLRMLVEAGLN